VILVSLLAVIVFQQVRIRELEQRDSKAGPMPVPSAVLSKQTGTTESSAALSPRATRRATRRADDPLEQARKEHTAQIEKQLDEISAPLAQDMASTMFKAEVKPGQSIVTGGYKTPDGRNQFTVLKPQLIRDASGQDSIRIDANIIDMGAEDITVTGLDSLATNAKNTLQHAETWEESDVSNTMETLKKSGSSDRMSGPTIMTRPGSEFTIAIGSNETGSYVLKGTATPSPSGSGVLLQTRIEQRDPAAGK
jgi:biotin carboxyl carrier protein